LALPVFVILAVLWAIVLVPPLLRSRTERSNDSIGDFNYRLDVLGRTNGAVHRSDATRVRPAQRAAKRRRDVLRVLASSVGVTGIVALTVNRPVAWALNGLFDIAFAGFLLLWAWARAVQNERALKVRAIPARPAAELALRRAASS
jgi:hypothetical protein